MSDRKLLPGKFAWFELITADPERAKPFYAEVLGWKIRSFPMGAASYDMIFTGETLDTMIGGFAPARAAEPARWLSYVSIEDVDAAVATAMASGGTLVEPAADVPGAGRRARITDPQGAELCLFRAANGNAPDLPNAPHGQFVWNELHTPDPTSALAFYQRVVGYVHESLDAGSAGTYYIVSRDRVERGGVTSHLPPGARAHWLPYVHTGDVDAALARARTLGGKILVGPIDIPDVGRFGVIEDPTGAALAVMKPLPRAGKATS